MQTRHHADPGLGQLLSRCIILRVIRGDQCDIAAVDAHEQGLAGGMTERADDRDLAASSLEGVADGTVAQLALVHRLDPIGQWKLLVDDPRGQNHPLCRDFTLRE
ncbi:hypothetical protein SSBR45G_33970 [Bradyrhizobium sp. SSBR45G]|nr:hypothetical protein SSBR45G_33970 [Bradyrhizobium sp. SSBR45G]GLH86272.1 hypothetical protein SSBR45R_37320 [Bradyrhizobium sp. SSBR45R]